MRDLQNHHAIGDLSNIRETSRVAEDSDVEFPLATANMSKRQKVSSDEKEQAEQEEKLLTMFTPILEEKMAEQMKSNEAMMERFKNSMMEAMHE